MTPKCRRKQACNVHCTVNIKGGRSSLNAVEVEENNGEKRKRATTKNTTKYMYLEENFLKEGKEVPDILKLNKNFQVIPCILLLLFTLALLYELQKNRQKRKKICSNATLRRHSAQSDRTTKILVWNFGMSVSFTVKTSFSSFC
jgi:hypothetical protein